MSHYVADASHRNVSQSAGYVMLIRDATRWCVQQQ